MTELEQYINANFSVAGEELSVIASLFQPEVLRKGEFYIKSGAPCDKLSFVQSGFLRLYGTVADKDITQWIFSKGYFIGDMPSLTFNVPSRWNIQALTDTALFTIQKDSYNNIVEKVPRWPEIEKHFLISCFSIMESRIFIKGRITDDSGKPIENVYILFYPFYIKKYDVTWYEKDTTLSDKNGDFIVNCERHQVFRQRLYFNKEGYFTTSHFFDSIPSYISIDTAIVLHNRQKHWFTARNLNQKVLGMTVAQVLNLLKLDVSQAHLMEMRNSDDVHAKALRIEAADSSMILLLFEEYRDSSKSKLNIMSKKIVGVGIAFTNGEKRFFGDAILYKRKVYNEYYMD